MKEYKLKINGGYDFIIISPQTISLLISQSHKSPEKELSVRVEDIMPDDFARYLMNVINSNRQSNISFRYSQIAEDPITKQGLYQIMREQLSLMNMDRTVCFESIKLVDKPIGEAGFDMECSEPFFWACKDSVAKFVYTYPDGRQEVLTIEY